MILMFMYSISTIILTHLARSTSDHLITMIYHSTWSSLEVLQVIALIIVNLHTLKESLHHQGRAYILRLQNISI